MGRRYTHVESNNKERFNMRDQKKAEEIASLVWL